MSRSLEVLQQVYGYDRFRGDQQAIIEAAVSGQDVLVLMPTGGGKSLCYQIPALVRPGIGLVISPLIALMEDQVAALQQLGIRAAFLNSSLDREAQNRVSQAMQVGDIDVIYVAPERVTMPATLSWLSQFQLSIIAIDEAHCVSQWGHNFRPDYLQLNILAEQFPDVPRMALTATATPLAREDIATRLQLRAPASFVSSFDRPNIFYRVASKQNARQQLLRFLNGHLDESGIVYCLSRKKVEATAQWLQERGFDALPYHAGLPVDERRENQTRFLREDGVIIVATVAFGMGIDKPDVRFVAHLDLPGSMEAYYQETGRAGRDGEPAEAWLVYGLNDVVQRAQMLEQSEAEEHYKRNERGKLDGLLGWCEVTSCRRQALLDYFGERMQTPCGHCDNCQSPPPTWDATEAAQKFLSCAYRSGQRFGASHLIDILLGRDNDKIRQHQHDALSTYGIGKSLPESQWRSLARQLLVRGLLYADAERYGGLRLTEAARPLLKGETRLALREDVKEVRTKKAVRKFEQVSNADAALWEALRACRKAIADEQGLAPYMVFHDATLMAMMEHQPTTESALLRLHGVGQSKLDKFGHRFLDVIRQAQY